MKWVCYMLNMVIPGTGLLILKRWLKGALLTLFSLIAWGLIIPALIQGYHLVKAWYDGPSDDVFDFIVFKEFYNCWVVVFFWFAVCPPFHFS